MTEARHVVPKPDLDGAVEHAAGAVDRFPDYLLEAALTTPDGAMKLSPHAVP